MKKNTLTVTDFARMGGKARMKLLNKQERIELARKAGSAPKKPRKTTKNRKKAS